MVRSKTSARVAVLEMAHVAKAFGGVQALVDAGLVLYPGEVHALLGENGAGKSTLLKTLAGVHRSDAGEITLHGRAFEQGSTRDSRPTAQRVPEKLFPSQPSRLNHH